MRIAVVVDKLDVTYLGL